MGYIIDCCLANLLSFVAGTAITWSSPMMIHLEVDESSPFGHKLPTEELSWMFAQLPLGAIFGPYIYGFLADKIGRKSTLAIIGAPFTLCFLAFALATVPWIYYVARFVIGMCIGGVFTVMPMYIGELSEPVNRGALGSSLNCFICFGFFFSHAAGSYLSILVFNLILMVFSIIFMTLFLVVASESPHYYVLRNKDDKAKKILEKIRKGGDEVVQKELVEMEEKIKEQETAGSCDIFRSKGMIKAFTMTVGLLFFQQVSGINAVLFYSEDIFRKSGSSLDSKICAIIVGSTQFLTSFLTPLMVDRIGRKILLIISAIGIIISEVPLGVYCYYYDRGDNVERVAMLPVMCLVGYIITFNIGLAILPWSIMGELFPDKVKSKASSAATSITWFVGFFISKYFPPVSEKVGMSYFFWIFAGFCALLIPFTGFFVIETKGKTLQEIQDILNG